MCSYRRDGLTAIETSCKNLNKTKMSQPNIKIKIDEKAYLQYTYKPNKYDYFYQNCFKVYTAPKNELV